MGLKGHDPNDLERSVFRLKTLYEVSRDLAGLRDSQAILELFLPAVMGPLGITFGYAVFCCPAEGRFVVAQRGLDEPMINRLEESAEDLFEKCFPGEIVGAREGRFAVLMGHHLSRGRELPQGTEVLVTMPMGEGLAGILGFGKKLGDAPFEAEDSELISGLIPILMGALKNSHATEVIEGLNTGLERQNQRLGRTLEKMERAREELNRRAFQIQTLYDASAEMAGIVDSHAVLETFLLIVLGAFSVSRGYLLVYGASGEPPGLAARGIGPEAAEVLLAPRTKELVLGLFVAMKDKMPHVMESAMIAEEEKLEGLPAHPGSAVIFALDEETRGVLALGERISDAPYTKDELRLMASLVSNFMVCLDNASQFETISGLNQDLERRNEELKNTLEALTSAKVEIDGLTRAKERILQAVRGGLQRMEKVTVVDLALILAVSLLLAFLYNFASPSGIAVAPRALFIEPLPVVDTATAAQMAGEGALLVDARPPEFFQQRHLPGAVNLPTSLFDFVYGMKFSRVEPERPIIVYGRTLSSLYDLEVADRLREMGHDKVMLLTGGGEDWPAEQAVKEGENG